VALESTEAFSDGCQEDGDTELMLDDLLHVDICPRENPPFLSSFVFLLYLLDFPFENSHRSSHFVRNGEGKKNNRTTGKESSMPPCYREDYLYEERTCGSSKREEMPKIMLTRPLGCWDVPGLPREREGERERERERERYRTHT
jgi:hypothetical protein